MKSKACIVIPIYKTQLDHFEQISLSQCFSILGKHDIYIICPEGEEKSIRSISLLKNKNAGYVAFDDQFFKSIAGYNRLLKYPGFYKEFLSYTHLLIYQLDAFVFRDDLGYWCDQGFDNIGAPLFKGYENAARDSEIVGQGNGGFCLRNVSNCYNVVTSLKKLSSGLTFYDPESPAYLNMLRWIKHRYILDYSLYPFQPVYNEDIFWAELVPKAFKQFSVPDPQISIGFSFEANPTVLFEMNNNMLPFGCHAWQKYDLPFWKEHIEAYGYKI